MQIKEVKEEHMTASSERYQSASELLKRAVPFPDSRWTPFRRRNWLARCEAAAGDRFETRAVDKANFLRVQQRVWRCLIPRTLCQPNKFQENRIAGQAITNVAAIIAGIGVAITYTTLFRYDF